jgi:glutathione S-transferase
MDHRLGEAEWLADDYSIADIACYPWVAQHEWSGIDLAPFPHLSRWFFAMHARPPVAAGMLVPAPIRDGTAVIETAQKMIMR